MTASSSRRGLLVSTMIGMGGIITGALLAPAVAYLFARPKRTAPETWVEVADVSALPAGQPTEVLFQRRRVDGWKVLNEKSSAWVVKTGDAEAFALSPACTHLGCAYSWSAERKEFQCPCHTSNFSIDGTVLSGPAPRPLDRLATRIVNGKLQVRS